MPKVTCICPTGNREAYLPLALECFRRQTFTDADLLIVDDGAQPWQDIPLPPRARYVWLNRTARLTTGAKRNLCCGMAEGEVIAHWDDDDWYDDTRLEQQMQQMADSGKPFVGHHAICYWDAYHSQAFEFVQGPAWNLPYACGTSMMYRKDYWAAHPFQDIQKAEDSNFSEFGRARRYLASYDGRQFVVARAHADSTSPVRAGQHECFPRIAACNLPRAFWDAIDRQRA